VLRLALAPSGEGFQAAQHLRVATRRADAMPGRVAIVGVIRRIGQLLHFRIEPGAAPGLDELLQYARKDFGQMGHIADRIFDLAIGQRAAAPVGEARAFVDRDAEPAFNEIGIADLFGLADRHHCDLGVEDRMRRLACEIVDDFDVLTARMEDLEHIFVVAEQVPERLQVDPVGQRIDRGGFLLVPDLHQAEFGPVGVLAHEFGVDADEVALRQPVAQIGERFGGGNEVVDFHRFFSVCRTECRPAAHPP